MSSLIYSYYTLTRDINRDLHFFLIIKSYDLLEKEFIMYLPRDAANQNRDLRGMYFSDSEIDLSQNCGIKCSEVGLLVYSWVQVDNRSSNYLGWNHTNGEFPFITEYAEWKGPTSIIQSHSWHCTEPSPGSHAVPESIVQTLPELCQAVVV